MQDSMARPGKDPGSQVWSLANPHAAWELRLRRLLSISFITLVGSLCAPSVTSAESAGLAFEIVTDVPLQTGGRVNVELPSNVYIHTTLGGMPEAYIGLVNQAVVDLGGYSPDTGSVVTSTLKDSLVWRMHAGWTPSPSEGIYVSFGYTLVTLGGGVSGEKLLNLATEETLDDASAAHVYSVDSTLHMLDAEIGWRVTLLGTYTFRVAAGFSGTVNATTRVAPKFAPIGDTATKASAFTRSVGAFLDDTYQRNVFTPTLSLAFGIRVF